MSTLVDQVRSAIYQDGYIVVTMMSEGDYGQARSCRTVRNRGVPSPDTAQHPA
jgi:hypothetical protein